MDRYVIAFDRRAQREFDALPNHLRRRFYLAFEELAVDPVRSRPKCDVRQLKGSRGTFALRVGAYRGLFVIDDRTIRFTTFLHRSVAYRES